MFPPLQWLPTYELSWLRADAVAGITLAAYAIPVSLAYALLAGLPPQHGIYCYLVAGFAYARSGGRWEAMGSVALEREIPGYGLSADMGAHWSFETGVGAFDKLLAWRQIAVAAQLTG